MNGALFFLKAILYTFFLFLLIFGGLELGVLGFKSWIGFLGLGSLLHGVWGLRSPCGLGPSGFLGFGAHHIDRKINLGKMVHEWV